MLEWALSEEFSDESLLNYGSLLEYASVLHNAENFSISLNENVAINLLCLVADNSMLKSLLGHRVFQNIMDRSGNKNTFQAPR